MPDKDAPPVLDTDEKPETPASPDEADKPLDETNLEGLLALITANPERAAKEIKRLRTEAAQTRVDSKELEKLRKEAADKAAAEKLAEEQRLLAEGNYKAILANREKELAEAQAALKATQEVAERTTAQVLATLDARKKSIPPQFHALIPSYPDPLEVLKWIEANAEFLKMPTPPNLNERSGTRVDGAKLTAEQKAKERERSREETRSRVG